MARARKAPTAPSHPTDEVTWVVSANLRRPGVIGILSVPCWMHRLDQSPELHDLFRSEDARYLLVRRLQRRSHVGLHRVPGGINVFLMARDDLGNRLLLRRIEVQIADQAMHGFVSVQADGLMLRQMTTFVSDAGRHTAGKRRGKQQRPPYPRRDRHLLRSVVQFSSSAPIGGGPSSTVIDRPTSSDGANISAQGTRSLFWAVCSTGSTLSVRAVTIRMHTTTQPARELASQLKPPCLDARATAVAIR